MAVAVIVAAAVPLPMASPRARAWIQPSELTDNEQQIVAMVRDGSTNREIAAALYLSVKAVESQLTRLYRRFNVRNRTQLLRAVDPRSH